jgi:tetratricopeptide (TPR) repeat protein
MSDNFAMKFNLLFQGLRMPIYLMVTLLLIVSAMQPGCEPAKEAKGKAAVATDNTNNDEGQQTVLIIEPGSNLLDSPQGGIILWLPGGEQVTVLESSPQMVEYKSRKNYWYRVRTKSGREGWIWGDDFAISRNDVPGDLPVAKTELDGMSVQELIAAGNESLQNDKASQALPYLKKAVEVAPADALAFFLLGLAYQQIGQDENAVEPYLQAIKLAPKDFWAHNNLGLAYIRTRQYEKAVEVLEKAVKLTPPSEMYNEAEEAHAIAVRNLATAYRSLGRVEEAEQLIAKQSVK